MNNYINYKTHQIVQKFVNADRFIPLRIKDDASVQYKLHYEHPINDDRKSHYRDALLKICNINSEATILLFSYQRKKDAHSKRQAAPPCIYKWPIIARSKEETLDDWPVFQILLSSLGVRIEFDMSGNDRMVIAQYGSPMPALSLARGLFRNLRQIGCKKLFLTFCVARPGQMLWNHAGDILAVLSHARVHVVSSFAKPIQAEDTYRMHTEEDGYIQCCCPAPLTADPCTIFTFDWRHDDSLLTGCSRGRLAVWTPTHVCQTSTLLPAAIWHISSSPNQRYMAVVCANDTISVLRWPLEMVYRIKKFPHVATAWHPWHESLVCFATSNVVMLWNVASLKTLGHYHLDDCVVTDLAWCKESGELVVATYNSLTKIVRIEIRTDLHTVLRTIRETNGASIIKLKWSSDSQYLLALTAFGISAWQFFGKKRKRSDKRTSIHNCNFGMVIR